jgi:hypothetical protein
MDFMSDQLFDGHRIRLLTLVDNHTRESLAIHVAQRIRGCEVVQVLERVVKEHGKPQTIQVDNVLNLESSFFFGYTDPCYSNSLNQTKNQVASTVVG